MELDDLIAQVEGDDPLDRLSSAIAVKADLDELGDTLIDHFVEAARKAGRSWSEIGTVMGVSKQAAQQRHSSDRSGRDRSWRNVRFTGRARTSVRAAQDAARDLGHELIGTEHLLLGMLTVSQSLAAKSLKDMGVTRDTVLAVVEPGTGGGRRRRHIPFSPLAKQALEASPQAAALLGHNYVGTEHLLLALLRIGDGRAAEMLTDLGVTEERVRTDVVARIQRMAS
jgi:hypothetical protein